MTSSDLANTIATHAAILSEGSVFELLRRDERIRFDPEIAHAGLIYDERSRDLLGEVHRKYIDIARRHGLPILVFADTWRASGERVAASPFRGRRVNRDNVEFLRSIVTDCGVQAFVGALTGPRGDAYKPQEAPGESEAMRYHAAQIEELAEAGVDLMMAATLPAFPEARGIARLMSRSAIPWILSFVVRPDGTLLDGTSLSDAIAAIDDTAPSAPLGYSVNCVHPDIARRALATLPDALRRRVVAFQGNTSMLAPEEVDGLDHVDTMDPRSFARSIELLKSASHIRVIGGCCGTNEEHIEELAKGMVQDR